STGREFNRR
ncbi:IMV membrane protein A30, partial [Monkeypox virus]